MSEVALVEFILSNGVSSIGLLSVGLVYKHFTKEVQILRNEQRELGTRLDSCHEESKEIMRETIRKNTEVLVQNKDALNNLLGELRDK